MAKSSVNAVIQYKDLLIAGTDEGEIIIYQYKNRIYIERTRVKLQFAIHCLTVDEQRGQLYIGTSFGHVIIYKLVNCCIERLDDLKVSMHELSHITWRYDSDVILTAGFDGFLTIINGNDHKILYNQEISKKPIRYICYDDVDGKIYFGTHEDQGIPVFELLDPQKINQPQNQLKYLYTLADPQQQPKYSHSQPVRQILIDFHTRYMFSCDHSGKILVFHIGNGSQQNKEAIGELDGHLNSKVRSICWLHDQKAIVSGGEDGQLVIQNVGLKKVIGKFQACQNQIMGVQQLLNYDPSTIQSSNTNQIYITSFGKDGKINIWKLTFKEN